MIVYSVKYKLDCVVIYSKGLSMILNIPLKKSMTKYAGSFLGHYEKTMKKDDEPQAEALP